VSHCGWPMSHALAPQCHASAISPMIQVDCFLNKQKKNPLGFDCEFGGEGKEKFGEKKKGRSKRKK